MSIQRVTGILNGMRVVEGSAFIAAPSGGQTLAALGADVIRFDNIGGGLDYRRWPVNDRGRSIYWADLNKGKRSIAVDLRHPEGKELLTALIAAPGDDAGLFLTNFPARGWLAYDRLRESRSDLIQLSISGDRHGGTALDYTVNALVGLPFLTGDDPELPVNQILPAWDLLCGQQAVVGLLAAERHRLRHGQGQEIKLSLADVAYATVSNLGYVGEKHITGSSRENHGNRVFGAFGRDFCSKDKVRFIAVAITRRQWSALVDATDTAAAMDALAAKSKLDLAEESNRYVLHDAISEILDDKFGRLEFSEIESALNGESACWSRYQTLDELIDDDPECSVANPLFSEIPQHDLGAYPAAAYPPDFGMTSRLPARPAPRLGQHTDEILATLLGLPDSKIGELHDRGVIDGP